MKVARGDLGSSFFEIDVVGLKVAPFNAGLVRPRAARFRDAASQVIVRLRLLMAPECASGERSPVAAPARAAAKTVRLDNGRGSILPEYGPDILRYPECVVQRGVKSGMVAAQSLCVDTIEAEARVDDGGGVQNNGVANLGVGVFILRDRRGIVEGSLPEGAGRGDRALE